MTMGGAGFSGDGTKGAPMKQQGHFPLLQLKASNHLTIYVVHTSALHGSSKGWYRSSRHCSRSRIAELFKVLVRHIMGVCMVILMVAMMISAVVKQPIRCDGVGLVPLLG